MPGEEANSHPPAESAPEPTFERVPEPTLAPAPLPLRLEEVDLLSMENLDLKIRNQQLMLQTLDHSRMSTTSNIVELTRLLETKRAELTKKYGRPVRRDTVTADGVFIPVKS